MTVSDEASCSTKIWLMLAYLLCNRDRMVPREELLRLLGDSGRGADPGGALRVTRLRVRRALEPIGAAVGKELILGKSGAWQWNPEVPVEMDTERFEALARQATGETDRACQLRDYREALALYQGDFLEKLSGDPWVGDMSVYFHSLYLETLEVALPMLVESASLQEAETICRAAIRRAPYQESLHTQLMRILLSAGNHSGAEEAYNELLQVLTDDLGVLPSREARELHMEAISRAEDGVLTSEMIREQLREESVPAGALLCDYNSFKLFYQEEARSARRRGDAVHLGIFSVEGKDGKRLSRQAVVRVMDQLGQLIQRALRLGDIAACCKTDGTPRFVILSGAERSRRIFTRYGLLTYSVKILRRFAPQDDKRLASLDDKRLAPQDDKRFASQDDKRPASLDDRRFVVTICFAAGPFLMPLRP